MTFEELLEQLGLEEGELEKIDVRSEVYSFLNRILVFWFFLGPVISKVIFLNNDIWFHFTTLGLLILLLLKSSLYVENYFDFKNRKIISVVRMFSYKTVRPLYNLDDIEAITLTCKRVKKRVLITSHSKIVAVTNYGAVFNLSDWRKQRFHISWQNLKDLGEKLNVPIATPREGYKAVPHKLEDGKYTFRTKAISFFELYG